MAISFLLIERFEILNDCLPSPSKDLNVSGIQDNYVKAKTKLETREKTFIQVDQHGSHIAILKPRSNGCFLLQLLYSLPRSRLKGIRVP